MKILYSIKVLMLGKMLEDIYGESLDVSNLKNWKIILVSFYIFFKKEKLF